MNKVHDRLNKVHLKLGFSLIVQIKSFFFVSKPFPVVYSGKTRVFGDFEFYIGIIFLFGLELI